MNHILNRVNLLAIVFVLSACGGGGSSDDNQQITTVQVRPLAYSQRATINVAGQFLSAGMTAVTGACRDPVFNVAQSSPQFAVLNCTVIATGKQPLTITSTNGKVLYTGSLTVPQPQVTIITSMGSIVVELNPAAAPLSVDNFLAYTNKDFYAGTLFHRVVAGFVAQGGGYTNNLVKKGGQFAPIELETNKGLLNIRGSLGMARTSTPNSATSEFYINLADNPNLDFQNIANPGYAVFGKVIGGIDVVDKISQVQTATVSGFANVPTTNVTIQLVVQTQ